MTKAGTSTQKNEFIREFPSMDQIGTSRIRLPGEPTVTKTADLPQIDVELPLEFRIPDERLIGWFVALALIGLFTVVCLVMLPSAFAEIETAQAGRFSTIVFCAFLIVFIVGSLQAEAFFAWNIYVALFRGPIVLTISEMGLIDLRISNDLIAWDSIESIRSVGITNATYALVLTMKPGSRCRTIGFQRLADKITPWRKVRPIVIDNASLGRNRRWIARQAILHLFAQGKSR